MVLLRSLASRSTEAHSRADRGRSAADFPVRDACGKPAVRFSLPVGVDLTRLAFQVRGGVSEAGSRAAQAQWELSSLQSALEVQECMVLLRSLASRSTEAHSRADRGRSAADFPVRDACGKPAVRFSLPVGVDLTRLAFQVTGGVSEAGSRAAR